MNEIVGCHSSSGEFNGRAYNNVIIQYISEKQSIICGSYVASVKLSRAKFEEILSNSKLSVNDLSGKKVGNIYYDRFGKVQEMQIL